MKQTEPSGEMLLEYIEGEAAPDVRAEVEAWMGADPENEAMLLDMAKIYYARRRAERIRRRDVMAAYERLSEQYDIIVIEGAGSPAEINLHDNDIVNMGMAKMADAPVILVADIDRGGVFASAYGTIKLLPVEDQERFCGIVINKFRGDVDILKPGLAMLEDLTGKPVLGVIPMCF